MTPKCDKEGSSWSDLAWVAPLPWGPLFSWVLLPMDIRLLDWNGFFFSSKVLNLRSCRASSSKLKIQKCQPNVKKAFEISQPRSNFRNYGTQRPKVGTHHHTLGSHVQNPQPKAQNCTNSSSPLHRLWGGMVGVQCIWGKGCATPIQFELLMGVPKLVASQKHFWTGFVAPPKFFMIFIRFSITHHLPFLVGWEREREREDNCIFTLHLLPPGNST